MIITERDKRLVNRNPESRGVIAKQEAETARIDELAKRAGISRSGFQQRVKAWMDHGYDRGTAEDYALISTANPKNPLRRRKGDSNTFIFGSKVKQ